MDLSMPFIRPLPRPAIFMFGSTCSCLVDLPPLLGPAATGFGHSCYGIVDIASAKNFLEYLRPLL